MLCVRQYNFVQDGQVIRPIKTSSVLKRAICTGLQASVDRNKPSV